MGKQAVLAWKVDRGSFNGVSLDGLSVVAALSGDRNLGMQEIGGDEAGGALGIVRRRSAQTPAQRIALVAMANELSNGHRRHHRAGDPDADRSSPITERNRTCRPAQVALDVNKHITHDPTCGAMQWFHPLATGRRIATMGVAAQHPFTGSALGTKWSDPNKRSAFFGTFCV